MINYFKWNCQQNIKNIKKYLFIDHRIRKILQVYVDSNLELIFRSSHSLPCMCKHGATVS